jgi:hypothetical protein
MVAATGVWTIRKLVQSTIQSVAPFVTDPPIAAASGFRPS